MPMLGSGCPLCPQPGRVARPPAAHPGAWRGSPGNKCWVAWGGWGVPGSPLGAEGSQGGAEWGMWDGGCWLRWEVDLVGGTVQLSTGVGGPRVPRSWVLPGDTIARSGQLSRVVLVLCPQRCCGTHLGVLCTPQPSPGVARSTLSICLAVPSSAYPGAHHQISTLSCHWTGPCASGAAALLPGQSCLPAVPALAGTRRFPCPQCPLLCCGSSGSLAASPRSAEGAI